MSRKVDECEPLPIARAVRLENGLRPELDRGEAAQVAIESITRNDFNIFQFQALRSRRFQRGFQRVNLRRPTWAKGCGTVTATVKGTP